LELVNINIPVRKGAGSNPAGDISLLLNSFVIVVEWSNTQDLGWALTSA
jgi:hypothetical protein